MGARARTLPRTAIGLTVAGLLAIPSLGNAQNVGIQNGIVTGVQQGNTANSMSPTPQTRNTFQVNNAINYWQYQQTTGMGPSIGWVRIITQFPQNGQQSGAGGSLNSGFTGNVNLGANGNGNQQQPNNGGSDPPSGVFLAANYGTLVGLPLQQQTPTGGAGAGFGLGGNAFGLGGNRFGVTGNQFGGKGIGGFGNGADGL
jgi:hypothetical protein